MLGQVFYFISCEDSNCQRLRTFAENLNVNRDSVDVSGSRNVVHESINPCECPPTRRDPLFRLQRDSCLTFHIVQGKIKRIKLEKIKLLRKQDSRVTNWKVRQTFPKLSGKVEVTFRVSRVKNCTRHIVASENESKR